MAYILSAIEPVMIMLFLMLIGQATRRMRILSDSTFREMNKLIFYLFIPCVLFNNIISAKSLDALNVPLILFCLGAMTLLAFAIMLVLSFTHLSNKRRGAIVQGLFRSNIALLGIPLLEGLYSDLTVAVIIIALMVPFMAILSIMILEYYRNDDHAIDFKKIIANVAKNPIVITSFAGLLVLVSGLQLPSILLATISRIENATTAVSLMVLGGSITFTSLAGNRRLVLTVIALKLLVVPAIYLGTAYGLGFRSIALATLIVLFAGPTAVVSYTTARELNSDSELTGQFVTMTTFLSVITLSLWITIFTLNGSL